MYFYGRSVLYKAYIFLFIATCIIFTNQGHAQSIDTVRINFADKEVISLPEKLNPGDFYVLNIEGINMNLYTVSLNSEDSTKKVPEATFPSVDGVGFNTLADMLVPQNPDEKERADSSMIGSEVEQKLSLHHQYLNNQGHKLKNIGREINNLSSSVNTFSLSYFVEEDTALRDQLKGGYTAKEIISKVKYSGNGFRKKITNLQDEVTERHRKYHSFVDDQSDEIQKLELEKLHKKNTVLFAAVDSTADTMYKLINSQVSDEWMRSIVYLENNDDGEYWSLPMQLKGDFTTLTVSVKPKEDNFGLSSYQTKIRFPYPSKFYTGVTTSVYYAWSLRNESFEISSTQIDSAQTEYRIVNEGEEQKEIGLASLFHLGWKPVHWGGIHFSIGPGISFSEPVKPRLSAGVGIALGVHNYRFTASYLRMVGFVDRKSNKYEISESYSTHPDNITTSKIDWSGAFTVGLMYEF